MAEEVRRLDGTVAQLTGDGLFALFGAPTAHEDDSERAVQAALAIHEALAAYARDVEEAYGVKLVARVGSTRGRSSCPARTRRRTSVTTAARTRVAPGCR